MGRKKQQKGGNFFESIGSGVLKMFGGSLKKRQRGGKNKKRQRRRKRQKGASIALKTLGGYNKEKYRRSLDLPQSRNIAFRSRRIDWL